MKTPAVLAMALLAGTSSLALADWVAIGGNDVQTAYIDPASVRVAADIATMATMLDFKVAQSDPGLRKPFLSLKAFDEFDCKGRRTRTRTFALHAANMGAGEVVYSEARASDWRPVPAESGTAISFKAACEKP